MEQPWFSMGLVTPLIIQYCSRVISSRMVMPYLWSVFLELVPSTFVSRCLSTLECVSPGVMLLIQYVLYHRLQDSI